MTESGLTDRALRRFWAKVDKTQGCWNWTGKSVTHFGYGTIYARRRQWHAHRLSWLIHYGTEPSAFVLHRCDNPACVRPEHLFLGDQADNIRDKVNKARQARGERLPHSKLTAGSVVEIRALAAAGEKHRVIAERFGVTRANVSMIVRRQWWKHV